MEKYVPNIFWRRTCVRSFMKIGVWHLGSVTCELQNDFSSDEIPSFFYIVQVIIFYNIATFNTFCTLSHINLLWKSL